jgi:hypothetical protein
MIPRYLWVISIGVVLISSVATKANEQAVVAIYATTARGTSQGTGFFVSREAKIVTAYHVIEGARRLEIFTHTGRQLARTMLVQIDPDSDVAVLKVDVPESLLWLQLSSSLPTPQQPLTVIGHPRGIRNQTLGARSTQNGLLDSLAISGPTKKPVFAKSVGVLPLDLTLYSGMSGTPVLDADGHVVGALSGSFDEGGSYAWAIPFVRIRAMLQQPPMNTLVDAGIAWEPLRLYTPSWRSAVKNYAYNTHALTTLELTYREIARLERLNTELALLVTTSDSFVSNLCISVKSALQTARTPWLYPAPPSPSERIATLNRLLSQSVSLSQDQEWSGKLLDAIGRRWESEEALRKAISQFYDWIAKSNLSDRERKTLNAGRQQIFKAYPELFTASLEAIHNIDKAWLRSVLPSIRSANRLQFLDELGAESFVQESSQLQSALSKYALIGTDASLLQSEVKMFSHMYRLMDRFKEYVLYLP